jgi:ferric enterobactin receptor
VTLNASLDERVTLLREAVVTGSQPGQAVRSTTVGLTTLSIRTLRTLPVLLGELDVMRSVQLLPGVSTVGEASSGFNVRGGSADQNLLLLDDVPLFNAQHLLGFTYVAYASLMRASNTNGSVRTSRMWAKPGWAGLSR